LIGMTRWLCVFAGVWLLACHSDQGSGSLLGATCHQSSECDASGLCVTDGKDGLCTLPCSVPGGVGECSLGSYCQRGSFGIDGADAEEITLCMPSCKSQSDCRDGYACNGVNGGPGKICEPK
jgi:hypothetical protein